jgi:hypothetical protein
VEQPLLSKQPIVGVFPWHPRVTLALLMAYFGLFGAIVGAQGELGAHAFVGGAAFALFNGAMFAGRLLKTQLVNHQGARASLLVSGAGMDADQNAKVVNNLKVRFSPLLSILCSLFSLIEV